MNGADEESPQYYSQATAAAMERELGQQYARNRQLVNLVGILHREADSQAATIAQLREDVEHWRSLYMRAAAPVDPESR